MLLPFTENVHLVSVKQIESEGKNVFPTVKLCQMLLSHTFVHVAPCCTFCLRKFSPFALPLPFYSN